MEAIIKRTTLQVRDMSKSLAFYEHVMGMSKYYDNELVLGDAALLPSGKPGDRMRLVVMQAKDPVIGMIGLLEPLDPKPDAPPVDYEFGFGRAVFVVAIDDVDEMRARAEKYKCKFKAPDGVKEYPAAGGGTVRMRSIGIYDPDGYFYECNQRL